VEPTFIKNHRKQSSKTRIDIQNEKVDLSKVEIDLKFEFIDYRLVSKCRQNQKVTDKVSLFQR
jgi:hypothetical protein